MPPSDDGLEKSATLLIALGEDNASEVLKHLGPREVQKLGHAMAALKSVQRSTVESVLDEFHKNAEEHSAVHVDTDNYIRSVLTKALGDDKASNLISRILQGGETSGIEGLKWMDATTVADLIKNEHPQIIATILVHLEHDHSSEILNHFTERLRIELGFDFATSNELEISGGKLTGRVAGDIVDAAAKAHHLARLTDELGLKKEQVIACGDGANDLLMMAQAGLSVAFHAKPATRAKADVAINFGGLDSLLNLFD